jgi:hypothetical protein
MSPPARHAGLHAAAATRVRGDGAFAIAAGSDGFVNWYVMVSICVVYEIFSFQLISHVCSLFY